jgi:hypothetical protein
MPDHIDSMKLLTNQRSLDFLKLYHVPTLDYQQVSGAHEVKKFPRVLKVDSPVIIHKAERRGVHVVHHKDHVDNNFSKLRKQGQVISQQHVDGHHFMIQVSKPPKGKKSLVVGLVRSANIHNDLSVRSCPIKPSSAKKLIEELRTCNDVLEFNGKKTRFVVLQNTLVALVKLASDKQVQSVEIDPFIVNDKFGGVADAKIVLRK